MKKSHLLSLLSALLVIGCLCAATESKAAYFYTADGTGGTYDIKTKTFADRRFHKIYRQKFDFSCGSAALASLLTFHYNRPTSEPAVIRFMYEAGDKQKIQREGFSLLDMKNYLQSVGLKSNGYREPLDKLAAIGIPAIVLINRAGYMHFVVIQGVTKNKVLFGDPAQGKKIVSREDFQKMWVNGIIFVVESELSVGRHDFNTVGTWNVRQPRDFHMPLPDTYLADTTLVTSFSPNLTK